MSKIIKQLLSILLVLTLVINLLPLNVLALETSDVSKMAASTEAVGTSDASTSIEASSLDKQTLPAEIVGEDLSRRSEYGKEFLLNNGLRLAAVYPTPVHYKEDGKWEEIDNTLTATNVNGQSVYSSGKGLWRVDFPQQLSGSDAISITKDGYTVSFGMAGEMRSNGDLVVASVGVDTEVSSTDALTIGSTKISTAQPQTIDTTSAKATAEFEETVLEKLFSRLIYPSVYDNTNVIYDLSGNQLKESVIIQQHDADLWGYRYALDTGGLVPVLNDDRSVDLLDPITSAIVMSMPAPFMLDANAEYCDEVEVSLVQKGDAYVLSYYLPREWMADESRAWPVVLDPIVEAGTSPNNILDHYVAENYSASNSSGALMSGYHASYGKMRTFIKFSNIPALSSADVLVEATLTLSYLSGGTTGETAIGAHKVNANWTTGSITWANQPAHNSTVEDCTYVGNSGKYSWNITDIARGWYEAENTGVMLKALASIESGTTSNWKKFYSVDYSIYSTNLWPSLTIQYRDAAGIEDYWDYTSSGAGRAGTGYVQNYTGNLVWVHNDMGFDGNRMPVSISHIYNAHDAWDSENSTGNNPFGMGNGWRTNFNQIIYSTTDGAYVWEDGDGTRHYFTATSTADTYKDTDHLYLTLTVSSTGYTLMDKYDNKSEFDTNGRLIRQVNNQATTSRIEISYDTTYPNRISAILDGVGRKYGFEYENGLLKTIYYYGTGPSIISSIIYGYSNANLTSVTYADTKSSSFSYSSKNLLSTATDIDGYKLTYGYNTLSTGKPSKVTSVTESNGTAGGSTTFAYTYNRTVVTDHNGNKQTLFFNIWGNTISVQDSEGRATFYQYQTDVSNNGSKNRLLKASQQQNTVVNLIKDHSFENETLWTPLFTANDSCGINTSNVYLGSKSMSITCNTSVGDNGVYSTSYTAYPGQSYTFSAYVYNFSTSVQLAIIDGSNTVFSSAHGEAGWERLEVTYTNDSAENRTITLQIKLFRTGSAIVDCVQLETSAAASRYNLLENADANTAAPWVAIDGSSGLADICHSSPPPTLSAGQLEIRGDLDMKMYIFQTVNISGNAGDCIVFGGWMRGGSLPGHSSKQAISVTLNNIDATQTYAYISPNPNLPSTNGWQYIASSVTAEKAYSSITFKIEINNDPNYINIDGLQLFREPFAEEYKYDGKGNVTETIDILGQSTKYTYDSNTNDLLSVLEPTGIRVTNAYDAYHRVSYSVKKYKIGTSVWELVSEDTFTYDQYGNITEHTYRADDSEQKSTYGYTSDGNFLSWIKDSLGHQTYYGYNTGNSTLEWIQYPNDTENSRQKYEYDPYTFKLVKTSAVPASGTSMYALYSYSNDRLTQIQTPKTTYHFEYTAWGQRKTVKIGNALLANYQYSSDADRDLIQLDYGNGNVVKYVYDDLGRVTQESYHTSSTAAATRTVTYAYDSTGALATTKDSATGRTTKCYYDDVGRVNRQYTTNSSTYHNLYYTYDSLGQIAQVRETYKPSGTAATEEYLTNYGYANGHITTVGNNNGTSADSSDDFYAFYSYDGFDRLKKKSKQRISDDSVVTVLDETLTYNNLHQVTSLVLDSAGFDRTYTYTYDANGNITSVTGGGYTTRYQYDSQNQLIREDNQAAGKTWVWIYDGAGNITAKKEYAYTTATVLTQGYTTVPYGYGNAAWGDLLTSYNGQTITYDAIGNPLSDGTWNYTWEQGRQLARMSSGGTTWSFTYDANGMRTKRTYQSTTYTYVYNGSQLTRMISPSGNLIFTYGADGNPLTIKYNGATYYYVTNLQGDVVAILNSAGTAVVNYTYDAWGKPLTTTGSMANTLGMVNPLRYRGYVYDRETGLYYLQSRYYNPTWGRFINADSQLVTGIFTGMNLFVYCNNNPLAYTDHSGQSPEWWQWAISGAMFVVGVAMIATGVGGVAGGALVCASVNSIINSYTSEAAGGSSTAGWVGGMITGAICGTGAGIAGNLLASATNTVGMACIGKAAASLGVSFSFGFAGSYAGQTVSAAIDNKPLNGSDVFHSALATGAVNCYAGLGSGMGTAIKDFPLISTTTQVFANALNAGWSVAAEVIVDAFGVIITLFG